MLAHQRVKKRSRPGTHKTVGGPSKPQFNLVKLPKGSFLYRVHFLEPDQPRLSVSELDQFGDWNVFLTRVKAAGKGPLGLRKRVMEYRSTKVLRLARLPRLPRLPPQRLTAPCDNEARQTIGSLGAVGSKGTQVFERKGDKKGLPKRGLLSKKASTPEKNQNLALDQAKKMRPLAMLDNANQMEVVDEKKGLKQTRKQGARLHVRDGLRRHHNSTPSKEKENFGTTAYKTAKTVIVNNNDGKCAFSRLAEIIEAEALDGCVSAHGVVYLRDAPVNLIDDDKKPGVSQQLLTDMFSKLNM
ncbi:hypothetical protein AAMO2058_001631200 [Amorphochlora amoebiformis]|eukprot:1206275-Amorphochlora_amoeboformis.AAC.2